MFRRIIDLRLKKDQFIEEDQIDDLLESAVNRTNGRKPALDQSAIMEIHQEVKDLVGDGPAFKKVLEVAMFERRKAIAVARGFKSHWVKPFGITTINKYRDLIAPNAREVLQNKVTKPPTSKMKAVRTKRKKKTVEDVIERV